MTPVPSAFRRRLGAEATLLLVTFFWGTTFVVVKRTTETVPVHWFTAVRFGMAALCMTAATLAAPRARAELAALIRDRRFLKDGAALGTLLFLGYDLQTLGLQTISATTSAMITGTLVIWTPLLALMVLRRPTGAGTLLSVPFGIAGLWLLVMQGGSAAAQSPPPLAGGGVTLLCAVSFAGHILLTRRLTERYPTGPLTAMQLAVVAVIALVVSAASGETRGFAYPAAVWGATLYLALFATCFAFWAQTKMQRFTTEERTALIFLFEPVFGAIAGYIVLAERLTPRQWTGAALILLALLVNELGSALIPGRRTANRPKTSL